MNGEELKTLKDLEREDNVYSMDTLKFKRKDSIIYMSELRQEAVKWIKEDMYEINRLCPAIQQILFKYIERWKERFNITEEDLK